ncbi:MAG: DUF1801 domain-containing protein [Thermoplasmatota archaeon]
MARARTRDAPATERAANMQDVAAAAERAIRRVGPRLKRVTKYGAPTYQGRGDVITIGVWTNFVAVGFWGGALLTRRHALLEGAGKSTRLVRLRTVADARSRAFAALVRDAIALDAAEPAHRKVSGRKREKKKGTRGRSAGPSKVTKRAQRSR